MGAFNPRHRLRSRVNPVRQMSQGEPRARRRLQPTVRAGIREDQSGGGGGYGDGGGDLLVAPPIGTNDSPEGREKWYEGRTNAANKSETRFLLAKFLLDERRIGKRDFLPTGIKQNNKNEKTKRSTTAEWEPPRLQDWWLDIRSIPSIPARQFPDPFFLFLISFRFLSFSLFSFFLFGNRVASFLRYCLPDGFLFYSNPAM